MSLRDTPGPGGFGPSPAFGHGHAGITLHPAQVTARPGVHSGGNGSTTAHLGWWAAAVAFAALAAVVVVVVRRLARRRPVGPGDS